MKTMIYADNAATTKLDIDAFEAMKPFLLEEYGNTSQPYSFARAGKKALKKARAIIAECIGALPEEVFFTSGGTESDNWAIKGIALQGGLCGEIITSSIEHHAVLRSCKALKHLGVSVQYLPVTEKCIVQPTTLSNSITDRTKLVSVMLANNEVGTIQPVSELADIAHQSGVLFHTDAVQAIGHIEVNVRKLGVDLLSASAHKFNGPKGIGFLYIRKGTNISPYVDGGVQESGKRGGTENIASIVAMATALQKNCDNLKENALKLKHLESFVMDTLSAAGIDYIRNGSENRIPGNISLSFRNADGETLLHRLDLMGICVSTGSACDAENTQISHVLKAIGIAPEYAKGTIRLSFGSSNTESDALSLANAIIRILSKNTSRVAVTL